MVDQKSTPPVLLEFIADLFPSANLYSDDPVRQAQLRFFIDALILWGAPRKTVERPFLKAIRPMIDKDQD